MEWTEKEIDEFMRATAEQLLRDLYLQYHSLSRADRAAVKNVLIDTGNKQLRFSEAN